MKRFRMATMLRIGSPPYLSAAPYRGVKDAEENGFELILAPPRQLGHLARKGELAAACLSLSDVFRLRRRFEPLGDFGIAVAATPSPPLGGPLLCLRNEQAMAGRHPLGIPREAATADDLLDTVWRMTQRAGLPPRIPLPPDRDRLGGLLLIGDDAITAAHSPPERFPFTLNLAAEWQRCTRLPWVLGCWVLRKDLSEDWKRRLRGWLERAVDNAAATPDRLAAAYCLESPRPWTEEAAASALRAYTHRLTDSHRQSVERFRRELRAARAQDAPLRRGGADVPAQTV